MEGTASRIDAFFNLFIHHESINHKLTGTVNTSNFDEWKSDLIVQIQSTHIELVTDDDFVEATNQVKSFKAAEKFLKQAKQSAINQAEEIQQLFSAIDDITEEARQARLSLDCFLLVTFARKSSLSAISGNIVKFFELLMCAYATYLKIHTKKCILY